MRLDPLLGDLSLARVRREKQTATQELLGACIALTDDEWQAPSLLPGWTRAHVATHLARNAEYLTNRAHRTLGREVPDLPLPDRDPAALERGSERSGLRLQEDLDESAGALNDALDEFGAEDWEREVVLAPQISGSAILIPLQRLNELVLHRVDLDLSYTWSDVSDDVAGWLLRWHVARRTAFGNLPDVALQAVDGLRVGEGSHELRGSRQDLLAWIAGRSPDGAIAGADSVERPRQP